MDFENKTPEDLTSEDSQFTELTEEEINASTVFSKPNIVNTKPKKKKTWLRIAIPLLSVIAVLLISLFLNQKIGDKDTSSTDSSTTTGETITVLNLDEKDIKNVEFKSKSLDLTLYPTTDSDEILWYIKGIEKKYQDTEATKNTVTDCINAVATIEREYNPNEDYGFDNPTATALITTKEGKKISLEISDEYKKGALTGAYMRTSEAKDKIYILKDTQFESYDWSLTYYINPKIPTAIKEDKSNAEYFTDELTGFDYFEFSGEIAAENYRFEMTDRENSSVKFKMVTPYVYNASTEAVEEFFNFAKTDMESYEVYAFNKNGLTAKELKKYGLDTPDATIKYKVGKDVVTIKVARTNIKGEEDFHAVIMNDIPIIYKVSKGTFSFLSYDYTKFVSSTLLAENIIGMKNLTLNINGKTYKFDVKAKENDEAEIEAKIKYDGKNIDTNNFTEYYYRVLSICAYLSSDSLMQERPKDAEEYFTVTIGHNKTVKDKDITLKLYKLKGNSTRFYAELDGNPVGLCDVKYANSVYKDIKKLINNAELSEID